MRTPGRFLSIIRSIVILLMMLPGCSNESDRNLALVVYAASSLQDVMQAMAAEYSGSGGDSLLFVFGSTADLSEQIAQGAPADLMFAADAQSVDRLASRALIVDSAKAPYAVGALALVTGCTSQAASRQACRPIALSGLADSSIRFIAIANPEYAPYGAAAKQVLERTGLWDDVRSKLVMGANIAQADQFVRSGNADVGFIALSLVVGERDRIYTIVDASLHDRILHTAGVVTASVQQERAMRFLRFVRSANGRKVLEAHGLMTPDAGTPN